MHAQILTILAARGHAADVAERNFEIQNIGAGPFIAQWNAAILGPPPTAVEIAAIDPVVAADTVKDIRVAREFLGSPLVEAFLVFHERQRFVDANGRPPNPQELNAATVQARAIFRVILKDRL